MHDRKTPIRSFYANLLVFEGYYEKKCLKGSRTFPPLKSGFSDTVTVFDIPAKTTCDAILSRMRKEHHIMLAGSFDDLSEKVIRIGHMGANANFEDMMATLYALS